MRKALAFTDMKAKYLFILLAILLLGAEAPKGSRMPKSERSKDIQIDKGSNPTKSPTDNLVAAINEISAELRKAKTEQTNEAEEEKRERDRATLKANEKVADETQRLAEYTNRLAFFSKALVGIGFFQALLFFWQLYLINKSTKAAEVAATAAQKNAEATVLAQRAYLNASPAPPDQNSLVAVEIKNYGATPATITAIAIHCGASLPTDRNNPGPPNKSFSGHYLVRDQCFFHWMPWPQNLGGTPYFLFGYVDYITEFKEHRRFGFARAYVGNQFVFVSKSGYSYDCQREKGEGNDWN